MNVSVISLFGLLILLAALAVFGIGALMLLVWMTRLFLTRDSASSHRQETRVPESPLAAHRPMSQTSAAAFPAAVFGLLLVPMVLFGMLWVSTNGRSDAQATRVTDEESAVVEISSNERRSATFGSLNTTFRGLQQAREQLAEAVRTSQEAAAAVDSNTRTKTSPSDVVLLRLSPQTVAEIAGDKGPEVIRKLAEGLPELRDQIRGTYALIPLYAPGSPLVPASRPVATMDGLRNLVSALSAMIDHPRTTGTDSRSTDNDASAGSVVIVSDGTVASDQSAGPNAVADGTAAAGTGAAAEASTIRPAHAGGSFSVRISTATEKPSSGKQSSGDAAALAEAPEAGLTNSAKQVTPLPEISREPRLPPNWLRNPEGGRRVVETSFVPASDQSSTALNEVVSRALQDHLTEQADPTLKPPTDWRRLIHLSLSEDTVATCVVDTFEQEEVIRTSEGMIPMRKTFALVEFPEAVDNAAMAVIRKSVQDQRIAIVGIVLGIFWAAALMTGLLIRLAARGSRWRKALAVCGLLVIPLPLILCSMVLAVTAFRGQTFDFPWQSQDDTVVINISG